MMLSRNMANAVPQGSSLAGFQPAISVYQAMIWSLEGNPGVTVLGAKWTEEFWRSVLKAEMVHGATKFERSESGCPIVDISQLFASVTNQLV